MERSFKDEIESLKLGNGETFRGEGILAVTKALLQSGVAYVGGYQGAPVSHLLDVMVQARDYLDELGVHVEACTNEASAAAIRKAREAALADPEGRKLDQSLEAAGVPPRPPQAKPMQFFRRPPGSEKRAA